MANFTQFFHEEVPSAGAGESYVEGDIVFFDGVFYGATASATLSDPVVATDFATNWVSLSGGGGSGTFLGLTDTLEPDYTGHAGESVIVNSTETGLIFGEGTTGGVAPSISSITFINDYTGNPTGTITPTGATHGDPGSVNYIEIAGSNFITFQGTAPTVCLFAGTSTTAVDLAETRLSDSTIRATIPASVTTDGTPSTARITVTTSFGTSAEFTINFSEGPSLTSSGTFTAAEGEMVSVTITATGDTPITLALASGTTLPSWLTFTDNGDSTATITGTIPAGTSAGTNPYTITATDTHNQTENITVNIGAASGIFGSSLGNSIYLNGTNQYLERTLTAAVQNRTYSVWFKRTETGNRSPFFTSVTSSSTTNGAANFYGGIDINASNNILAFYVPTANTIGVSDAVIRDASAWYHIVQSETVGGTPRIWLNGVEITAQYSFTSTSQQIPSGGQVQVGRLGQLAHYAEGYVANAIFVDGSALTASSFGEFSDEGYWQPIQYPVGATGSQGFILNFDDSSNFGLDSSTNGNNSTVVGAITGSADTVTDNMGTWTPLRDQTSNVTFSNGLRTITGTSTSEDSTAGTMVIPATGQYYYEITARVIGGSAATFLGIGPIEENDVRNTSSSRVLEGTNSFSNLTAVSGTVAQNVVLDTSTNTIGWAIDATMGQVQFYVNGAAHGVTYSIDASGYEAGISRLTMSGGNDMYEMTINTGQEDFMLTTLPTGFSPLSTANFPDPAVAPQQNFGALAYAGNNPAGTNTSRDFTIGFQPDLVIIKNRNSGGHGALWFDSIRGDAFLDSTDGDAEDTGATNSLSSFNANGWTLSASGRASNRAGDSYASYAWRAGGTAVANTAGTLNSMVSANPDAGFSIVEYTTTSSGGSNVTVGHGLSQAPELVIIKRTDATRDWFTYTTVLGEGSTSGRELGYFARLNTTAQFGQFAGYDSTATTFGQGQQPSSENIAYCWHSVPGYSAIGRYTGNGSTDGPLVYTGFKPAFVMVKRSNNTSDWYIYDNAQNPYNPVNNTLAFNTMTNNAGYGTDIALDFYSNGFKLIDNASGYNTNGGQYIYMAFAESPFRYSLGR